LEKDYVVLIKDGNGSNRKLRLFLSPDDGDIKDGTYEPTGVWAELAEVVKAVSHEVKRRGSKD
jgi:hypothetical protein